jgi:hypothetical protein
MSNPKLREFGFTEAVPVNSVVVDEASQIETGQYFPLFEFFGDTLRKLCFIGDNQQREAFSHLPVATSYPLQCLLMGTIA